MAAPAEKHPHLTSLAQLPVGARVRLKKIQGGRELARRLLGLGIRLGSEVHILHHRGRGVVLAVGDTRVALGGGIADKLLAESLATGDPTPNLLPDPSTSPTLESLRHGLL